MNSKFIKSVKRVGDVGLEITWPDTISEEILQEVIVLKHTLSEVLEKQVIDMVQGYHSLMLYHDPVKVRLKALEAVVKELINNDLYEYSLTPSLWEIPVCYQTQFGIDLDEMAAEKNTSKTHIVQLHTMVDYTVYFIGFLPGFMYLGGLNDQLHFPRKMNPRAAIPKGSVAIGGQQTGVYPCESPAGWNIIGNTPISFFDVQKDEPCFVSAGDKVRFRDISSAEYAHLQSDIAQGKFDYHRLRVNE